MGSNIDYTMNGLYVSIPAPEHTFSKIHIGNEKKPYKTQIESRF